MPCHSIKASKPDRTLVAVGGRMIGFGNTDWMRYDGSNTGVGGEVLASMEDGYGMVLLANGDRPKGLGIIAVTAIVTFLILESGVFEPGFDHVEAAVASELRDPSGAQFRNIREGAETACGEVNAKNAFGA